jgi:trehalose-6-phosphate synthase
VHVLCPSCSTENNINVGHEIVCGKCKASLSGFVYRKYKEPLLTAISALVIGAYGSYEIEHAYFDDARYPIRIEYAIIDSCVTADRTNLSTDQLRSKKQICLCAFEKTSKKISYAEFEGNVKAFSDTFRKNANSCK